MHPHRKVPQNPDRSKDYDQQNKGGKQDQVQILAAAAAPVNVQEIDQLNDQLYQTQYPDAQVNTGCLDTIAIRDQEHRKGQQQRGSIPDHISPPFTSMHFGSVIHRSDPRNKRW